MNTTSRTRRHAYVDESKAKDYLLVSVALDSGSLHRARGTVRSMILPGQSRLHMRKESDRRRRYVLEALSEFTTSTVIVRAPKDGRSDRERRSRCVAGLIRWSVDTGIDEICFELDETLQRQDLQRIVETLHVVRPKAVNHRHERAAIEPLLALPDAIGWAWAKGGDRRRRAGAVTIKDV